MRSVVVDDGREGVSVGRVGTGRVGVRLRVWLRWEWGSLERAQIAASAANSAAAGATAAG